MSILCRDVEEKILYTLFKSNKPEFLALYGRRRVGKTYLIRRYFNGKSCIFFNATGKKDGSFKEQIAHFVQSIGDAFYSGMKPEVPQNWDGVFNLLTQAINNASLKTKIILFIDELPWLATRRSGLLGTIDYYWNHYWSMDNRIKLIVCGSSASWIIDNIINNKGGLHNRVTQTLCLEPFNLASTKKFLKSNGVKLNNKQITEIYMVTGGVPYYLSQVETNKSSTQAIEKLVFKPQALLLNEFNNLFRSLFDAYEPVVEMIEAIARHRDGIGQEKLFNSLKKSSKGETALKRLKALEDAGFIISFIPHMHKEKGVFYKVIDEYTLFYLHWIRPLKKTKLAKALEEGYWQQMRQTPKWASWAGKTFEAICYKHLKEIRRALELPLTSVPNAWRYSPKKLSAEEGTQIDLLFDRPDSCINICEIKYTDKPFQIDKAYAANLIKKVRVFKRQTKTDKHIFISIISASGLKNTVYSEDLISGVITLEDLF